MKKVFFTLLALTPQLTMAAEHALGEHQIPKTVLYQAINFTILVILLAFLTKEKVRAYFTDRAEQHTKAKEEAKRAYSEAQQKHEEVSKKLQVLHAEEASTIEKAQEEAKELKSKLIHEAEALSKNIIDDAKKTATYEYEKAKQQLRQEVLEEALRLAQEMISKDITEEDKKYLRKQFVENVGTVQ